MSTTTGPAPAGGSTAPDTVTHTAGAIPGSRQRGTSPSAVLLPALVLVVFLIGWHLLAASGTVSELILPAPVAVAEAFADITWGSGMVWLHLRVTLIEALLGFTLGSVAAAVIAVSAALSPTFKRMMYPYIVAFQVTPRIAVAPIIIAALGFGMAPKVVIGATICFFPVLLNMLTGLLATDPGAEEMFRSLGATKKTVFRHLMLPTALPVTMAGLQTGMSFALIGVIVGEFISGSEGLGYLVKNFSFLLNIAASYAVLAWLMFLGLALFGAAKGVSRIVVFWESDEGLTKRTQRKAKAAGVG